MIEAKEIGVLRGRERVPVLDGVDLALNPGELLAVVGPNGAGKTTLLRCLAGVLEPSTGEVRLDGRPLAGLSRREVARAVAYSPQQSEERFGFTVRQAVLMGRHPWLSRFGQASGEDEGAADRAMRALDLSHLAQRSVTSLSGGEKRRAALARTLAQGGSVYLLDEPAAGLDIRHALMTMRAFAALARGGAAVAVVLHDLNLAAMFCPAMLMLGGGRIAAYGPTSRVLTSENVARVFGVRARIEDGHVRFLEE
ncbi:ABC transporter ATP-binding protein [Fundidesulfovibrio terrae]|uniref:ABC transporter ATP-binding protein n=1 Tax=Fundidesulfovibrio terrae TaxID=2922866 RepID=UPI001FAEA463|nr:ABC transporter ATP-binding protein [Fundidesulfovibrio terrae]